MSTRFFASVRRNQRQWMVVVTILSIFSFLFLDNVGRGNQAMSPFSGGLMIGFLCAAGLSIVGYPRGKTTEFGAAGFAAGFLAGFLGFGAVGANKPVAVTSIGNFSRQQLDTLVMQRQKINRFIGAMARTSRNTRVGGFPPASDTEAVTNQMLLADAKKMGIQISDKAVNEFLRDLGTPQVTQQEYKECLREARLGEGEMFDILKSELAARLVAELSFPPAYVPPIAPQMQQFIRETPRILPQTPFQLWDEYQKLNLKESLQVLAFPVSDFVSKVSAEPPESELAAVFERFKLRPWVSESQPGFAIPPRVQLAYLTADYEKFEKSEAPTDAEIAEHYEKNKERYRIPGEEWTKPKTEETAPPKTEEKQPDAPKTDEPVKEKAPESKPESAPATEEKKPEEKPADAPKEEAPKEPAKPAEEPKANCGDDPAPAAKPEEKKEEPKPAAAEEKKEEAPATPAADSKPAEPKPAESEKPTADAKPNEEVKPVELPAPSATDAPKAPEAAVKYRELNDELKDEIREAIMRERAFRKISVALDKAYDQMINLGLDYDTTVRPLMKPEKPGAKGDEAAKAAAKTAAEEKAKAIAEKLQAYAKDHNLEYHETKELSFEDLAQEPIGTAIDSRSQSAVVNEVFAMSGRNEPRIPTYSPHRVNSPTNTEAYAYWKIADLPGQIADLKDEATRAKVISVWKFSQAQKLAEARAKALLDKIKAAGNDVPASITSETVTGDANDPALTMIPTEEFTWLSQSRGAPGQPSVPRISTIPLISDVDNQFMKTVFEDLNDGDVGLVSDSTKSTFYVVKVLNRATSKNDDGGVAKQEREQDFLKTEFTSRLFPLISTPYESLAQLAQRQIDSAWQRSFQEAHAVTWETQPSGVDDSQMDE